MKRTLVLPVYGICVHNTRMGEAIANPNPETLKLLDQFYDEGIGLHERNFFGVSWGHPVLLPEQSNAIALADEDKTGRKIIAAACSLVTSADLHTRVLPRHLRRWMVPIEDTAEYDLQATAEALGWEEEDPEYEILLEVWEAGRKKTATEPKPEVSAPAPDPLAEIRGVLAEHAERLRALESVLKKVVRTGPGPSGSAGPSSGGGGVVNAGPEVAGAPGISFLAGSGGGGAALERFVVKPNSRSPVGSDAPGPAGLRHAARSWGWLRNDGNHWNDSYGGIAVWRWGSDWTVIRNGTREVKFVTEDEALAHALLLRDVWLS